MRQGACCAQCAGHHTLNKRAHLSIATTVTTSSVHPIWPAASNMRAMIGSRGKSAICAQHNVQQGCVGTAPGVRVAQQGAHTQPNNALTPQAAWGVPPPSTHLRAKRPRQPRVRVQRSERVQRLERAHHDLRGRRCQPLKRHDVVNAQRLEVQHRARQVAAWEGNGAGPRESACAFVVRGKGAARAPQIWRTQQLPRGC